MSGASLSQPKNEIIVNFPVKMDSGEIRLFKGYRVQHNNILGPFKGGMRYAPMVTLDEVKALATMMTWKGSLMGIPYGGGKGGIKFDPRSVSTTELQRITRRFTHALGENIGPEYDIPAPDMGTNSQTMAWMMDTYSNMVGAAQKHSVKGVVTGKPVSSGGTLGRTKATGQGMVHCLTEAGAKDRGFDLEGATMSVQGFGKRRLALRGSSLPGSSACRRSRGRRSLGIFVQPRGFQSAQAPRPRRSARIDRGLSRGQVDDARRILGGEGRHLRAVRIGKSNRRRRSRGDSGARDGRRRQRSPTHPAGEKVLLDRGIDILPDVLANSGGVTVSYYEWVQNKRSESWTLEEVDEKLETAMKRVYRSVDTFSRQKKVDRRIAAYALALQRIESVYKEREIFP